MTVRFFKKVSVTEVRNGYSVFLDGHCLTTPKKHRMILPNKELAQALADEWESVVESIDLLAMPLNRMLNTAFDRIAGQEVMIVETLLSYAKHDMLCYRACDPHLLVVKQDQLWNPIVKWFCDHYDISFTVEKGLMPIEQSKESLKSIEKILLIVSKNLLVLTGLSHLTTVTGSLILSLAVIEKYIVDSDKIYEISCLESLFQQAQWREDKEAQEKLLGIKYNIEEVMHYFSLIL